MLKLMGAAMVVAASGLGGLAVAANYSRRPRELKALRSALQMLETEVVYSATPLPEALARVAGKCDRLVEPLFSRAAAEFAASTGITAADAWEKALVHYYPGTALKPQDLSILRSLGSSLGRSDREDQVKHLHLAMEQLKTATAGAEEEAARNIKLWSYLGFLGGLITVLVIY
ncbi:MAG TPA: stage III sporulation protein SpoIIIAB [Bacillota bacterium]|jgi:stage III sporulation protein AB|nr:stage III sporulation protein SpoIIIAB [Peptococcaceae bacterium MAG4]NLW38856.1 stage III sporulation protein AB [Peptococcaceae bacterium]HPU35897.1 stage III sporulation protein SpoIIIAB [Bacillota bacterium]HPZ42531.1 stage III sporulation protein SpoIIIAB [Bacillota bacterium]HQD76150.1 stage III sporulation protein SpoIIIAB [Bacillota bacterium]